MAGRLKDKVCIITGTGGSMGLAAALLFAREGALVVGSDINAAAAEAAAKEVTAAGGVMVSLHPCDLTDAAQCQKLVDLALEKFGRIDVLYNNAAKAYFNLLDEMPEEEWKRTLDEEVNLVFLLTKAAWPHLKESRGVIVNTASASAWRTFKSLPAIAHATAKAGIIAMTRHMAMEGRAFGIRANSVSPGVIETNQTRAQLTDPVFVDDIIGRTMMGRAGQPEEIANVALFLASNESSYVTGIDILADGGMSGW